MSKRITLIALPLLFAAVACGEDVDVDAFPAEDEPIATIEPVPVDTTETTDPVPTDANPEEAVDATIVFVWSETGGCAMAGPNCARYEVAADGTVQTSRSTGVEFGDVEATGTVDIALVDAWLNAAGAIDVVALQERVGPGEMTAAFDGTDVVAEAPTIELSLSSIDTNFARNEPVFAAGRALAEAARAAAPLELQMR